MKTKLSDLLLTVICIGTFLLSCKQSKQNLSLKQFTQIYLDSLKSKYPTAVFSLKNDTTINSVSEQGEQQINPDNAYLSYKASPDSLTPIINDYVFNIGDILKPDELPKPESLFPQIKPNDYLTAIGFTEDANDKQSPATAKYNDQLMILFVNDTERSVSSIHLSDIDSLHLTTDKLRVRAIENLENKLADLDKQVLDGIFSVIADGFYESSAILLKKIWTKEFFPVSGDFVIGIPNRDILLVTGSEQPAAIEKMKNIIESEYSTGGYAISPDLFKWNGKSFVKWEP